MTITEFWPLFGLRVVTPVLELRYPDDETIARLAALALRGIHDPAWMPFGIEWTDVPADELPRNSLQHYWRGRASLTPDEWNLDMAVVVDGEPVGTQSLVTRQFPKRRGFTSGSWLGRDVQGRGIGTEMRRAILHLAFAGLGARYGETEAWHDNAASLGVTRKLGYTPNGEGVDLRRGEPDRMLRFRMTRERWEANVRADDIELVGLEPCLPLLLGAGARGTPR